MKVYAPAEYPQFSCIADACRHNCCIGWEIDVDAETLERYRRVPGTLGQRLREQIALEPEPHFCLGDEERCPFLNEKNLCDLIAYGGGKMLCQICADHPRFRNEWSDRVEIGLGMCCEAAGALILNQPEGMELILLEETEEPEEPLTAEEQSLLHLRQQMFRVLGETEKTLSRRFSEIEQLVGVELFVSPMTWAKQLLPLERLDETWTALLMRQMERDTDWTAPLQIPDRCFARIGAYFLYRHLPEGLYEGNLPERTAFALNSTRFLRALCVTTGAETLPELVELCRLYSSEIEYSDENLDALLLFLETL